MSIFDNVMQAWSTLPAVGIPGGIYNQIKGSQEMDKAEKNRPVYQTPDEIKKYVDMAQTMSNSDMPGSTQAKQNIEQSAAGGIKAGLTDPAQTQKLLQNEMNAFNNLNIQKGQYHNQQIQQYQQALKDKAKYSDQEFEYNTNASWQRKYNKAINQFEAGGKQVENSVNDAVQIAGMAAGMPGLGGVGGQNKSSNLQYNPLSSLPQMSIPDFNSQPR